MKLTRQQAINENCKTCIYDPLAGGTHTAQIEACTVTSCALYEYRPLTEKTKLAQREETYRNATPEMKLVLDQRREKGRETLNKFRAETAGKNNIE